MMVNVFDAVPAVGLRASVTVIVTVLTPAAGVPEMTPDAESMERVEGSPVAVQAYGGMPPEAATVVE